MGKTFKKLKTKSKKQNYNYKKQKTKLQYLDFCEQLLERYL